MRVKIEDRLGRRLLVLATVFVGLLALAATASAGGHGNVQLDGLGSPGDFEVCDDPAGADADFPILIEGGLDGCLYQYWGPGEFRPSGTYIETGTELFVGCLADGVTCGTFETTYLFTGKYADTDFSGQEWGRCQHPIVSGTGTGDFTGATGRLDFRDDVEAGNFVMRGHIKLP